MLSIPFSTSVWEYRTRPVVTSKGSVSVQRNFEMCLNTISCVQITAATILGALQVKLQHVCILHLYGLLRLQRPTSTDDTVV